MKLVGADGSVLAGAGVEESELGANVSVVAGAGVVTDAGTETGEAPWSDVGAIGATLEVVFVEDELSVESGVEEATVKPVDVAMI